MGADDHPPTLSIGNLLFHPLSAFRDDLKHNALTRLHWGLEPPNPKRRRLAWFRLFFPSALYLFPYVLLLGGLAVSTPKGWLPNLSELSPQDLAGFSVLLALSSSVVWMALVLLLGVFRLYPPPDFLPNIEDYTQAGLTGGQILWGFTGNYVTGILAAAGLHLLLLLPATALYSAYFGFGSGFLLNFVLGLAPIVIVILFSLLQSPLWVLMPHALGRLIVLCAIGLSAPALIGLASLLFTWVPSTDLSVRATMIAEPVTWLLRFYLCRSLWRRAERKLTNPRQ